MIKLRRWVAMLSPLFALAMSSQLALAAGDDKKSDNCPEPGQIDWSKVPGPRNNGPNDVSQDFVNAPDPLNDILSNDFTAWETPQRDINGAFTSTGRAQRKAVVGDTAKKQSSGAESTKSQC